MSAWYVHVRPLGTDVVDGGTLTMPTSKVTPVWFVNTMVSPTERVMTWGQGCPPQVIPLVVIDEVYVAALASRTCPARATAETSASGRSSALVGNRR